MSAGFKACHALNVLSKHLSGCQPEIGKPCVSESDLALQEGPDGRSPPGPASSSKKVTIWPSRKQKLEKRITACACFDDVMESYPMLRLYHPDLPPVIISLVDEIASIRDTL